MFFYLGVKPIKRDKILINKDLIPYKFSILLGAEEFVLTVKYNKKHDLFTIGLEDSQENTICTAEPLIYGQPLWGDIQQPNKYPGVRIIPYDESGQETKVTYNNLGETVFLFIDNYEDELVV